MEKICPVCNELELETFQCNKCGENMVDKGRVQEYLDNYSADMPINDSENYCVHLYQCEKCNYVERISIKKEKV